MSLEILVVLGEVLRGELDGKQAKAVNHYRIDLLVRDPRPADPSAISLSQDGFERSDESTRTSLPVLASVFVGFEIDGQSVCDDDEFGELFEIGTHADIGSARVSSRTGVEDRYVTASAVESVNTMSASIFRRESGRLTGCAATSVQGTPSLRALADRVSMMERPPTEMNWTSEQSSTNG